MEVNDILIGDSCVLVQTDHGDFSFTKQGTQLEYDMEASTTNKLAPSDTVIEAAEQESGLTVAEIWPIEITLFATDAYSTGEKISEFNLPEDDDLIEILRYRPGNVDITYHIHEDYSTSVVKVEVDGQKLTPKTTGQQPFDT